MAGDDVGSEAKRRRTEEPQGSGEAAVEEAETDEVDEEYFEAYDDLAIHTLMLGDAPRVDAYLAAIRTHRASIEGRVVMDVGAGSGILAMLAAKHGGAKCVYAVEAAPGMAQIARALIARNGLADTVHVVEGRVEDVSIDEKVDVIISEWMGFYLVHESMLESVFLARDRFLKPGGVMMPSSARIWAAPIENDELRRHLDALSSMHGLDLEPIRDAEFARHLKEPQVEFVKAERILASPVVALDLGQLAARAVGSTAQLAADLSFVVVRRGNLAGVALWFDVSFDGNPQVVLSTSPSAPATHWKQTVVYLGVFAPVEPGEVVELKMVLRQSSENPRQYDITLET